MLHPGPFLRLPHNHTIAFGEYGKVYYVYHHPSLPKHQGFGEHSLDLDKNATPLYLCVSSGATSLFHYPGALTPPPVQVGTGVRLPLSLLPKELLETFLQRHQAQEQKVFNGGASSSPLIILAPSAPPVVSRSVTIHGTQLQALPPSMRGALTPVLLTLLDGWCITPGCELEVPWGVGGKGTLKVTVGRTIPAQGLQRIRQGATVFVVGGGGVDGSDSSTKVVSPWKSSTPPSSPAAQSPAPLALPAAPRLPPPPPPCPFPGLERAWVELWEGCVWAAACPRMFSTTPPPRGVLLTGPSGVGKTALVTELVKQGREALKGVGVHVAYIRVSGGDVLSPVLGESERRLGEAINVGEEGGAGLRRRKKGVTLVFLDDLHAMCPSRGGGGGAAPQSAGGGGVTSRLTTLLLTQMDGLGEERSPHHHLFFIGATSKPSLLDPALRRSGRFEREVLCPIPTLPQRTAILHALVSQWGLESSGDDGGEGMGLRHIAEAAAGYVGADLVALVSTAVEISARRQQGVKETRGPGDKGVVTKEDLWCALGQVGASVLRGGGGEGMGGIVVSTSRSSSSGGSSTPPFSDIGGLGPTLDRLKSRVIAPFKGVHLAQCLGVVPSRGILFHGPPGNSKTTLAHALAVALGASFFPLSCGEILSCYVGEGERRVRGVFALARAATPALIFFDELDALVGHRGIGGEAASSVTNGILATLLTEMDGVVGWEGVLVVGATNRLTALDPALLRPGRLETHFHIPLPTPLGREDILRVHTRNVALCSEDGVDFRDLALRTEGYSGAQLKDLCTRAGMIALRERVGVEDGTSSAKEEEETATIAVTMSHFKGAL